MTKAESNRKKTLADACNTIARLEQENVKLKVDYGCLEDAHAVLNELYEKLEKENAELEAQNVELIGKVAFLENDLNNAKAQIEKMKSDVKQEQSYWNTCDMQYDLYQRLLDKWEIRK